MPTAEYKARLKRVLKSVEEEDRKWVSEGLRFADKIRHTRNYHTHFEERLRKQEKVASDAEIILLTERMQCLLEVCFLKDLGLDGPPVRKIVGKPLPRVVMIDLQ